MLLVEGLYLLHQDHGWQLDGLLDECWYLDVDLDTAMERLIARHQASWSLSRAQAEVRLARNDRDMKWKKFLYKQLCDRAEINACRAPSCSVCSDYARCFGPEDAVAA